MSNFLNGPTPASFCLFSFFSIKHYAILKQVNVKIIHSVSGARIQTHNFLIMSLKPYPPDLEPVL